MSDDVITNMLSNTKRKQIVTELFIRGRCLYISIVFYIQFCFAVPKNIRVNSALYFIMKIPIK